ncbi:MAG: FAD-dependent oxidoreductase [Proteobacteria bacterium]|nr:FAD-dependent oxidoreductase [Pseudomonadota bacterium]
MDCILIEFDLETVDFNERGFIMTLRLHDVEVPVSELSGRAYLAKQVANLLEIPEANIRALKINKKSLDARRKARIVYHYQVDVDLIDEDIVYSKNSAIASIADPQAPSDPLAGLSLGTLNFRHRPVIIGSGPSGIFTGLTMALAGQPSIIVERGEPVEKRIRTTNKLRSRGIFTPESNYCFGEGGAGTFSDGKLTCGRNHPLIRHVFDQFVNYGAPEEIQYDAKPHIGTDFLIQIAKNMRTHLQKSGCDFHFGRRFVDFKDGGKNAKYLVVLDDGTEIPTDHLIVAVGHSARDTYEMLLEKGLSIVPKPFAMGARIEHPQDVVNKIQFGSCDLLPAAEYKLAAQSGERGIWTFCMCPGGHLMPTNAQEGHLAINGMSYHARKSGFANAAVVVNVLREDFYRGHPLDGMRFQAALEQANFKMGGSNYHSPAQRLSDFLAGRDSKGALKSTYKPGIANARLDKLLPSFISDALRAGVKDYDKKMRGYICEEGTIVGIESKTSSPISMMRGKDLQSTSHPGIFPAGEGAGFAGGIVSAALDGVKIGRAVLENAIELARTAQLTH